MSIRGKILQGYKWNVGSAILMTVIQASQVYYTAKFLTPADFGIWGIVVVVAGFVLIFNDVGIGGAIIHHQNIPTNQLSSLYWFTLLVGIGVALLILLLIPAIGLVFHLQGLNWYFIVLAVTVVVISAGKQYEFLLQKELLFKRLSQIEIISSVAGFIAILVLLNLGYKVGALIAGFFFNSAIKTLLLLEAGFKKNKPGLHFRWQEVRKYISFGLFQLGEKNVNYFAERFDQILIGRMLGATQLGFYSFAFNLIYQPISKVNPIINKISLPVFALIQHNSAEVRSVFFKKLRVLSYANASILLGLAGISHTLILSLFGEKWQPAIVLLQLLSVVFLFKSIWNPMGSVLLALGKASIGFYWNILLVAVTVPVIYISSLTGNVETVALWLAGAQVLLFVPNYFLLVKPALGACFYELVNALVKPFVISATMAVVVFMAGRELSRFFPVSVTTLFIQILLGIFVQSLLIFLFDRKTVRETLSFMNSAKTSSPEHQQLALTAE